MYYTLTIALLLFFTIIIQTRLYLSKTFDGRKNLIETADYDFKQKISNQDGNDMEDDKCWTNGGKQTGNKCIFPFIYKGTKYNGCTSVEASQPWCTTSVDGGRGYIKDMWGNCASNCKIHNGATKVDKPRLLKLKIYLDDFKVDEYKKLYGKHYKKEATKQLKMLTQSASIVLRKLDNDGFIVKMDGPLLLLSESQLSVGKTYIDRTDNNREKLLDVNHKDFTLGLALALQDRIKSLKDFQPYPDTLVFLLTPFKEGRELEAVTEENCICKKNPEYPCIGVWAHKKLDKAALLAHEIAHALGAELHDPYHSITIMEPEVKYWYTEWSQYTNYQIKQHDNTCLETTTRPPLPFEKEHKHQEEGVINWRATTIVKHIHDCIPPCNQPEEGLINSRATATVKHIRDCIPPCNQPEEGVINSRATATVKHIRDCIPPCNQPLH